MVETYSARINTAVSPPSEHVMSTSISRIFYNREQCRQLFQSGAFGQLGDSLLLRTPSDKCNSQWKASLSTSKIRMADVVLIIVNANPLSLQINITDFFQWQLQIISLEFQITFTTTMPTSIISRRTFVSLWYSQFPQPYLVKWQLNILNLVMLLPPGVKKL